MPGRKEGDSMRGGENELIEMIVIVITIDKANIQIA